MRTVETVAIVTPDGTLTAKMPSDIAPGEHHVVVVLEQELKGAGARTPSPLELKMLDWSSWPEGSTFRREDMYGDDGR